MATLHSPDRPTMTRLTVPISVDGMSFTFRLCQRPLNLGPGLTIPYYWMDSSQFRLTRKQLQNQKPHNLPNCIGHWWRCMQAHGLDKDPDQQLHLLLASIYGLVAGDKGLQHVYRDSYLAPGATIPEEYSQTDSARNHLGKVVRSKNISAVGAELDQLFG
ncbi:MAG: hypothetical protein ACKO23_07725, partial [Gemmataceae bacterium]